MTLPLLLSVPHAGLDVPPELASRCLLTPEEITEDGDVGAREIYALESEVSAFVTTGVARAVLDMNRGEDDRRLDGVVKTHTCWNVPVWREPLDDAAIEELFVHHHRPYHAQLSARAREPGLILAVDGHTMAAEGPPVGPDAGVRRPAVCLSNADGTCPRAWIEGLARCFERAYAPEVSINAPFRGGYITRTHAAEMPWVQLELSRAPLYPLAEKRRRVFAALQAWCASL